MEAKMLSRGEELLGMIYVFIYDFSEKKSFN